MKNFKSRILWLAMVATLPLSLVACNSGGTPGDSSSATNIAVRQNFLKQFQVVPTPMSTIRPIPTPTPGPPFPTPVPNQYTIQFPNGQDTTLSQGSMVFYDQPNCAGNVLDTYNESYPTTYGAGVVIHSNDAQMYLDCSVFKNENCTQEMKQTFSIGFSYTYSSPESGTVYSCLSNSVNPYITNNSGEFLFDYVKSTSSVPVPCAKGGACGFSQSYSTTVYSQDYITEVSLPSSLKPGVSGTATVNLVNMSSGVQDLATKFNLTPIVKDSNGVPAIGVTVTALPSTCYLGKTGIGSYNTQCTFIVTPSVTTHIGSYTLSFTNNQSFGMVVKPFTFQVLPFGTFTINNQSYIESIIMTPLPTVNSESGDWTCDNGATQNQAYTLSQGEGRGCLINSVNSNINLQFNVTSTATNLSSVLTYKCTGGSNGVTCNSDMSAVSFNVSGPLGFSTYKSASSVTYDSPACPLATSFIMLYNDACASGGSQSAMYDNQTWTMNGINCGTGSGAINSPEFESAVSNWGINGGSMACTYTAINSSGSPVSVSMQATNQISYIALGFFPAYWSNYSSNNQIEICNGGAESQAIDAPLWCQFQFQ